MDKLQEEYMTVKIMLEQYIPYTHGIERALDLLEQHQKRINQLEKINLVATHLMTDKQLEKLTQLVGK